MDVGRKNDTDNKEKTAASTSNNVHRYKKMNFIAYRMKWHLPLLLLLILTQLSCTESNNSSHNRSQDKAANNHLVNNSIDSLLLAFSSEVDTSKFKEEYHIIPIDLNDDNIDEYIIEGHGGEELDRRVCGSAGCPFYVYRYNQKGFVKIGEDFGCFEGISNQKHNGYYNIIQTVKVYSYDEETRNEQIAIVYNGEKYMRRSEAHRRKSNIRKKKSFLTVLYNSPKSTGKRLESLDYKDKVAVDLGSGIAWTIDGGLAERAMSISQAERFINILNRENYAGYSDWRLPLKREMLQMISYCGDYAPSYYLNAHGFKNLKPNFYWLYDMDDKKNLSAMVVDMRSREIYDFMNIGYVWIVRNQK